ncbi:MBL fold metallo-hydrolase [Limibacter armeniacum]|uniref:MBL fold metallo-hydrolase n=1 Tax=Limibacter armeniacum TaxID=466084 RepID=UPI002FE539DF
MKNLVEQIYTGCLAQGAYYIESKGEAAIIDPLRETAPYIKMAEERGAKIKYVFETHFHADFVSGHVDLAKKTGATIVYGPTAQTTYDVHVATDNEEFKIGDYTITVLHTPGHTMESSTFLLKGADGKPQAIFTGDTLFIGDVGRPDLAVKSDELTKEDLAGMLFDSLHNKILPLPNDVIVYPGHGAGSACGKNISKETTDTLGNQKKTNYALQDLSKDEFIKQVTNGILPPPQYFAKNAMLNKKGYEAIDEVLAKGLNALTPDAFEKAPQKEGVLILDTRAPQEFNKGFVKGAINIGLSGKFAGWVGALIEDLKTPILLVTDEGSEEEAVTRLSRVGYDNPIGFLKGGFKSWENAGKTVDSIKSIPATALEEKMKEGTVSILDVRNPNEYLSQHIEGAVNFPLDYINEHLNELDKDQPFYLHCAGGYRSMIATSILRKQGYHNIVDVTGGFGAIKETGIQLTAYVCPSTL